MRRVRKLVLLALFAAALSLPLSSAAAQEPGGVIGAEGAAPPGAPDLEEAPWAYDMPAREEPGPPGQELRDEGGLLEKAIALPIEGLTRIVGFLARVGDFQPLDRVVFNVGVPAEERDFLPFTREQWGLLDRWYGYITVGFSGLVLLAVIATAFKFMGASVNAEMKADASESVMRWIGAVLLVGCAPFLVRSLFWLNNAMVETLLEIAERVLPGRVAQLPDLSQSVVGGLTGLTTGSYLGTAVVKLGFVGIMVYLNIIFLVRRFVLMSIYVFTPVVAWLWAVNKNVNAMGVWVGELLSNAFMQTCYAVAVLVFLTVNTDLRIGGGSWLTLLVTLGAVVPVGEMLRNGLQGLWTRLSGVDESLVAQRGMLGLAGLGSIAVLSRAAAGGGSGAPGILGGGGGFGFPGGGGGPGLSGAVPPGGGTSPASGPFGEALPGGAPVPGVPSAAAAGAGPVPDLAGGIPAGGGTGSVPGPAGAVSAEGGPPAEPPEGAPVLAFQGSRVSHALAFGGALGSLAARSAAPFAAVAMSVVPGGDRLAQTAVQAAAYGGRAVGTAGAGVMEARTLSREQGVSFWEGAKRAAGVQGEGFLNNVSAAARMIGYPVAPGVTSGAVDAWQRVRSWSADGGLRA